MNIYVEYVYHDIAGLLIFKASANIDDMRKDNFMVEECDFDASSIPNEIIIKEAKKRGLFKC